MSLDKLRYYLTDHNEKFFFTYDNNILLIHPSVYKLDNHDLLNKMEDDIHLIPNIKPTIDKTEITFNRYSYNEDSYPKSELLAFIYASIDPKWHIIKGLNLTNGTTHFYLRQKEVIYDPALNIITSDKIYSTKFKDLEEIKGEDIISYLSNHNNLAKYYQKKRIAKKEDPNFSLTFINKIIEEFNNNIAKEYTLDEEKIEHIKNYFMLENFLELRQVLSQKRKWYLKSSNIATHPDVDPNILNIISQSSKNISDLMQKEYNLHLDYYHHTLGNCYALSILLCLFDERFKLIQGGIPYQKNNFNYITNHFYQHSWLEIGDFVYDPALRIITPKSLYYQFVIKQDEYSKEDTENILRRIGFNLTHFRDFMNGIQIGNNETIRYRMQVNKIDSKEMKEEGERLISLIKEYKEN